MPRQLLPFALAVCLLLAGCVTAGTPGATGTDGHTDTTTAGPAATPTGGPTGPDTTTAGPAATTTPPGTTTREGDCPPPANYSARPLPDRPSNVTAARVLAFVERYEEATVWNRLIRDDKISLGLEVSSKTVVNRTPTGYVVHVEGGFGFEDCLDGAHVAGDGIVRANYFVNATTVVRLGMPENRTTDPRGNGSVVERWK